MQLEIQDSINPDSVFHLGELHIIFDYLKVIGKYIENSGLDQIFWTDFALLWENMGHSRIWKIHILKYSTQWTYLNNLFFIFI